MGITIVIVTHDPLLARKVDRVVSIRDGKISSEIERLQLPQGYLQSIGMKQRVRRIRVELADGKIILTPPDVPD